MIYLNTCNDERRNHAIRTHSNRTYGDYVYLLRNTLLFIFIGMNPLKQKFNIVFQPKDRRYTKRKKFMISVNQLAVYIGKSNEAKVLFLLENSLDERWIMKFRKHGKLWIYSK